MGLGNEQRRRLSADLADITIRTKSDLSRQRAKQATSTALDRAGPFLLMVPGIGLLAVLAGHLFGAPIPRIPLAILVAGSLAGPIVFILSERFAAKARPVTQTQALAALDRDLGSQDRLASAADFLEREDRTPFMEAAIADAAAVCGRAKDHRLTEEPVPAPQSKRVAPFVAGAAVLIALASIIPAFVPKPQGADGRLGDSRKPDALEARAKKRAKSEAALQKEVVAEARRTTRPSTTRAPAASRADRAPLTDEVKKTRGSLGEGRAADAQSASGAGEARGTPSNQGQSGKSAKKKSKKKRRKKGTPKPEPPAEAKKPEDPSGSTAGRGAASGSNKSPAASPWNSRDQVVSEDEPDLEDDEEVDDEIEDSEARGGVQPQLRDRKPPVNRDLGIGFGNGKNPDANGRGGPSAQKKSRGVASLVLGVPIPDHIKGQPNPGRTKITQERVDPRAEHAAQEDAARRRTRKEASGFLHRPALEPWMRTLVRTYFLNLRQQNKR